jgi:hypothetical protein
VLLAGALFAAAVLADFASRGPEWPAWSLAEAGADPAATRSPVIEGAIALQRRVAPFGPDGAAGGAANTSVVGLFGALASAAVALAPGLVALRLRALSGRRGAAG